MKKSFSFFFFFFLIRFSYAQNSFFQTSTPVYKAVLSHDSKTIAFADFEQVYIMDVSSFKILKQWNFNPAKKGFVSELFFHPSNNALLNVRYSIYNNQYMSDDGETYPEDSFFVYNLHTGTRIALPGNMYVGYEANTQNSIVAYNNYAPYGCGAKLVKDDKPCYYSTSGGFVIYPEQKEISAGGIIAGIQINHDNTLAAIAYYDALSPNGPMYTMELRNLPAFTVKTSKHDINEKPVNMCFSKDGKFIYFETHKSASFSQFILNTNDLTETKKEESVTIEPFVWNNELIRLNGSEVENINFQSARQNWKIWPNLTKLFSFNGVLAISEDEVLVFGQLKIGMTLTEKMGGIEKIKQTNIAVYSKNEEVFQTDTLFNPVSIFVQDNQLYRNKTYTSGTPEFSSSLNENFLLVNYGRTFQLWSMTERKKIHEFIFDNEIKVFGGNDEKNVLILEKYDQMKYNEYKIHVLNIETGIMKTKVVTDVDYRDFTFTNECKCIPSLSEKNAWNCITGHENRWVLSGDSLYVRKANSDTAAIPDNNESNGNKGVALKLNEHFSGYEKDGKFMISNTGEKKERVFIEFKDRTLRKISTYKNTSYFILESKTSKYDSLKIIAFDLVSLSVTATYKIPHSTACFALPAGLTYIYNDKIYTWLSQAKYPIVWSSEEEKSLGRPIDFDGKHYLLFEFSQLIDLSTLKTQEIIPIRHRAKLLKGDLSGNIIYTDDHAYTTYANEKPFFQICIAPVNSYKNVSWKSEKLDLPKNAFEGAINAFAVSPGGNYAIGFKEESYITESAESYLIDLKTKVVTILPKHKVYAVHFSDNEQQLVIITSEGKAIPYSTITAKKDKIVLQTYSGTAGMPGKILLGSNKGISVNVPDRDTVKQEKFYYSTEPVNTVGYIESKGFLVGGGDNGNLYFWKPEILSPFLKIKCGTGKIYRMTEQESKLFVFWGTSMSVIDLTTMKLVLTMSIHNNIDANPVTWFTPEGFFSSAKNDIKELHIIKGLQAAPILSYEMFLNRPDLLLERMGLSDTGLIEAYKAAYQKRLKRYGYPTTIKLTDLERPELTIVGRSALPVATTQEWVNIDLKATSATRELNRLNIYVNGVPVYGSGGLKIHVSGEMKRTEKIKLHSGANVIEISVFNDNGVESTPVVYEVELKQEIKSKVYFIGIGVSRYRNKDFNLRYASKDARDIESMIRNKYPEAEIHLLVDSMVTRQKIKGLKNDVLSKTTINDMVIVSFSGHGLIDPKLDFYYATYDVDFENPAEKGLLYSDIEWLVDSIPARKKLILVDACHSGEIDKEEVEQIAEQSIFKEGVQFRASGFGLQSKTTGVKSTGGLMNELFSDLRKGTGSTVISSSSAVEYSMESGEWKNGLFTYCFINGLKYKEADGNHDGKIMLSELQRYLRIEVAELSNGAQQPTSRMENTSMDFRIW